MPQPLKNLALDSFFFNQTGIYEPPDPAFQAWLAAIPSLGRTGVLCTGPGGKNLRISAPGPAISLTWDGGNSQADYIVARAQLIPAGPTTFSAPLPPTASSYSDPAPPSSSLLCYQVVARDGGGATLGLSDFDCGYTGFAGGTVIPGNFTLGLNQTSTASLTWTAPAGGPVDGYALYKLPLDGSPITF